ncbi:MAG: 1-aminocyclopropane-1-carboxylate deaminase/D-cysteine desulfhydrase [Bacteroidota bacterium]
MFLQKIQEPIFLKKKILVYIYRLDLLPPHFSGNKWFKLKYNLENAKKQKKNTLLSFGGAYSNHIYTLAKLSKAYNFNAIGIIRGEKNTPLNPILSFAQKSGMHLTYLDRATYKQKHTPPFIKTLKKQFGDFYYIPEGGSNVWAVKGSKEIINQISLPWDYICTPCGTAGTLAGLVVGAPSKKKILGFAVLKNASFLKNDTHRLLKAYEQTFHTPLNHHTFDINLNYHFGGYAKKNTLLTHFITNFIKKHHIPIEYIYTGKMLYGIYDLANKNFFPPNTTILALHTGGLYYTQKFE